MFRILVMLTMLAACGSHAPSGLPSARSVEGVLVLRRVPEGTPTFRVGEALYEQPVRAIPEDIRRMSDSLAKIDTESPDPRCTRWFAANGPAYVIVLTQQCKIKTMDESNLVFIFWDGETFTRAVADSVPIWQSLDPYYRLRK